MVFLTTYLVALSGVILLAAGFIVFHFVARHPSLHLRAAGTVLLVSGILVLSGTGYYAVKHRHQSFFDDLTHAELPLSRAPMAERSVP